LKKEPWKVNALYPLNPANIERWKSELKPAMIAQIEAVVWREMINLGFKVRTRHDKLLLAVGKTSLERVKIFIADHIL
jgi:hypothetical protein